MLVKSDCLICALNIRAAPSQKKAPHNRTRPTTSENDMTCKVDSTKLEAMMINVRIQFQEMLFGVCLCKQRVTRRKKQALCAVFKANTWPRMIQRFRA